MKISPETTKCRVGYPALAKAALLATAVLAFASCGESKQEKIKTLEEKIAKAEERIRLPRWTSGAACSLYVDAADVAALKALITEWEKLTGKKHPKREWAEHPFFPVY